MSQGSILGPLLWNLEYHNALRATLLSRIAVFAYVDDAMAAVRGDNKLPDMIVYRIQLLGLKAALTNARVFEGYGRG